MEEENVHRALFFILLSSFSSIFPTFGARGSNPSQLEPFRSAHFKDSPDVRFHGFSCLILLSPNYDLGDLGVLLKDKIVHAQ